MLQIAHQCRCKMGGRVGIGKGAINSGKPYLALRGKSFGLDAVKVKHKRHFGLGQVRGVQKANIPGFDHSRNLQGRAGDQLAITGKNQGLVIGHKIGPKRHKLQGKRRFSGPRCPKDQQPLPPN